MTKLVSRDPILRFKEGRKIIKAYEGFKTKEGPTGNYYYTGRDGKNYVASLYGNKWVYSLDDGNFKVIGDVPKNYETTGGIKFYSDLGRALSREAIARTPRKPWTPELIKADRAVKKIPDTTVTVEQAEKNNKTNQGKVTVNSNTNNKNSNIKTNKNVLSSADTGITSGKNSINFKTAFNNARNSGLQEFTWRGQKYNTKKAGEKNYIWLNGNWVNPNQNNALTFKPVDNLSLELPKVTVSDLAGVSGNTSVVQPTKVEPVIQPRNYFNYTLPNYDLIAQNRLKQSGIRTYLKQGGNLKFKFSNKG